MVSAVMCAFVWPLWPVWRVFIVCPEGATCVVPRGRLHAREKFEVEREIVRDDVCPIASAARTSVHAGSLVQQHAGFVAQPGLLQELRRSVTSRGARIDL